MREDKIKDLAERAGVRPSSLESAFIMYISMLAAAALITLAFIIA